MTRATSWLRPVLSTVGGGTLLCVLVLSARQGSAQAQNAAPVTPPAKTDTTAAPKAEGSTAGSIKENIKNLGREVSDPTTLQRIKAHEQEAEKKVERTRDRQRKDHGRAKPGDAVDLAKSLDKPDADAPGDQTAKAPTRATAGTSADGKVNAAGREKNHGAPPPAPVPGSAKPAPAR